MYCWANLLEPIGCPRNRTPFVISAFARSAGERNDSACSRHCLSVGSRVSGDVPSVEVRIVVLFLFKMIPKG